MSELVSRAPVGTVHAPLKEAVSPFRQLMKWGLSQTVPASRLMLHSPQRSGVSLTFDDGPHPNYTPRLLELLSRLDVRATFFVIGSQARRYPAIVRQIQSAGHVIGNHTWTHGEPRRTTTAQFARELDQTNGWLRHLTGELPKLMRPPKGKLTAGKMFAAWNRDHCIVLWNRDPRDYTAESGEQLRHRLAQQDIAGGDIVLLHDAYPYCLEALPDYVARVRDAGLDFGTPLQWLQSDLQPRVHAPPTTVQGSIA